jgi:adenylylsulfate kinase
MSSNMHWHASSIVRADREALHRHRGVILWYTGLSGSGKSTLANAVASVLHNQGVHTFVLDGDNVRMGLSVDLGFAPRDREENIRRVQEVAKLFLDAGVVISTCLISPYRAARERLRRIVPQGDYIEIFCRATVQECERRDVKGLYAKARSGEVKEFTGISAPYEEPQGAELVVDTGKLPLEQSVRQVVEYLAGRGIGQGMK